MSGFDRWVLALATGGIVIAASPAEARQEAPELPAVVFVQRLVGIAYEGLGKELVRVDVRFPGQIGTEWRGHGPVEVRICEERLECTAPAILGQILFVQGQFHDVTFIGRYLGELSVDLPDGLSDDEARAFGVAELRKRGARYPGEEYAEAVLRDFDVRRLERLFGPIDNVTIVFTTSSRVRDGGGPERLLPRWLVRVRAARQKCYSIGLEPIRGLFTGMGVSSCRD